MRRSFVTAGIIAAAITAIGFIIWQSVLHSEAKPHVRERIEKALRDYPDIVPHYERATADGTLTYKECIEISKLIQEEREGQ